MADKDTILKRIIQTLILSVLIMANFGLLLNLTVLPVNINTFFPENTDRSFDHIPFIENTQRLLFVNASKREKLDHLLEQGIINEKMDIPGFSNTSILLFERSKQNVLLEKLEDTDTLGPTIVGEMLSEEFIKDIQSYVLYIVPLILPLFIFLTSLRYSFFIAIEMLVVSLFFLLSTITFYAGQINIAFLLSLVFSYIYAFTILNYFYYGNIKKNHLIKGITVSLLTTLLSAFFLMNSSFPIIQDFGLSLLNWMTVLGIYILLRSAVVEQKTFTLHWLEHWHKNALIGKLILGVSLSILLGVFFSSKTLSVNLNPVISSHSIKAINDFESRYLPAQPLLLRISSRHCSYKDVNCVKSLSKVIEMIDASLPIHSTRIMDIPLLYTDFSHEHIDLINKQKLAQFLIALEFSSRINYLISDDTHETYMLIGISIKASTDTLSTLMERLEAINKKEQNFTIEALNHLSKVQEYKVLFTDELLTGMGFMLGFIILIFLFYYRSIWMAIAFLPSFITIALFFALHVYFSIEISLMSFVALILFIGLIGDNIIHIFLCYKKNGHLCFETVYRPIILTNILMILFLSGMLFTGTLLEKFGLELGFLLSVHLLLLIYVLPLLIKRHTPS